MKKIEFGKAYYLSEIVDFIKTDIQENGLSDNNYCLYVKDDNSIVNPELTCYLESYPSISDEDEEVYPDFVVQESLELLYDSRLFEDVIMNLLHQKENATIDEFILGLNYYSKNDTFMDI